MSQAATLPAPDAAATREPRRLAYGDAVRVWGTWAVVIGHVCDMVLFRGDKLMTLDWWVCNVVDSACRWAVPAYIMLSGALLLSPARPQTPTDFYRRRLSRIGIPLVFWSVFFMAFSIYYTRWVPSWTEAMKNLALGQPYAHLHFVYRIAGLYAFTPLFRVVVRHADTKLLAASTALMFLFACGDSIMNGINGTQASAFARFAPFVAYYFAGHLLREAVVSRRALAWCWAGVIVSVVVLSAGGAALVGRFGLKPYPSMGMLLHDFMSPVRIVFAICAWLLLVNAFYRPGRPPRQSGPAIAWLAPLTLGIYLVHPLFRELLYAPPHGWRGMDATRPNVWLGIPLNSLLVYALAVGTTAVLMRIPFVRRVVD